MFRIKGEYLVNERGMVVEVQGNKDIENANVAVGPNRSTKNQQWTIAYADELVLHYAPGELNPQFGLIVGKEFSIVTSMGSGRYLDIVDNNVVLKRRNGFDSQKWYFHDESKTIKSVAQKSKSWSIQNSGKDKNLEVFKTNGDWFQQFRYIDNMFVVRTKPNDRTSGTLVLGVEGNKDVEG
jgi:hypothetical protein